MIPTFYDIVPCPKPRQTRRDKWMKRPCVIRYRNFADQCRAQKIKVPEFGATVVFHMPMPKSWSKKKRALMCGEPHQQKPDIDNLLKALLDALYKDDSCVWGILAVKIWAEKPGILIAIKPMTFVSYSVCPGSHETRL